jgi:hypothetical protein
MLPRSTRCTLNGVTRDPGTVRRTVDWLVRDRVTGRYVVGQWPNVPLVVFLVARGLEWWLDAAGTATSVLHWVGTVAIVWWAGDELVRGVNPFRRLLGAGALVAVAVSVLERLA